MKNLQKDIIEKYMVEITDYFNIEPNTKGTSEEHQGKMFLALFCVDTLNLSIERSAEIVGCATASIYRYLREAQNTKLNTMRYLVAFMVEFYKKHKDELRKVCDNV